MPSADVPGIEGLGYRLKAARKALEAKRVTERVTQVALGTAVGVTEGAYAHWEAGRAYPDLPTVVELSALLGVTASWLAFGEGSREASADATLGQIKVRAITSAEAERARRIVERDQQKRAPKKKRATLGKRRPGGAV